MKLYLYPYKMGSRSASELAAALKIPQIRHIGSRFKGHRTKTVVNWGASELPHEVMRCDVLNPCQVVRVAGNKLDFFRSISHKDASCRLVPWTPDRNTAKGWLDNGAHVFARHSLTGHSGQGIEICKPGQELPSAPLFTKYVPKDSEWRVHCAFGEVIDVQRKIRDPDREPSDWKVRSHSNGFIYVRNTETPCPEDVTIQALKAYHASGLDFGGFDVVWNRKAGQAFVVEGNTAVGLEGQTVEKYRNAFLKKMAKGV